MQFVRNMLDQQRKRLLGSLMQYLEQNVYQHLSVDEQQALRQKVLQAVSAHHDVCLDLLKSSVSDGSVVNAQALELIEQMHSELQEIGHIVREDYSDGPGG